MILEGQIQIFSDPAYARQSFHFKKITEEPNINIFLRKLAWSYFYIKEQTQKYKF